MSFHVHVWMSIQHQYSEIHLGHSVLHNVVHMPMQCVDIRGKYGDWLLTKKIWCWSLTVCRFFYDDNDKDDNDDD